MEQTYLLSVGFIFCCASFLYLALNLCQRHSLLRRLGWRQGKASLANTPPQPLTPEEKQPQSPSTTAQYYASAFPPSRRHVLRKAMQSSPHAVPRALGRPPEDLAMRPEMMVPYEAHYLEVDGSKYTPTGFSAAEIRALGDFPNYAELSGVPLPEPYHQFDLAKARPRPYRPFRWAYHQTMSLSRLETDWWLELENSYQSRISQRQKLFEQHGKAVLQSLPGSELACKELMEMVLQFLVARYPQYFSLSDDGSILNNRILNTTENIREVSPLLVLLNNVPEDFGIMLRHPVTGYYCLRAGIICSALGWNVGTKIGLQLHEIHAPIPDYKEKMQFSMDRFFSKMPTDKPIQRGSWGLEVDQPLYMPPGDPHEKYRDFQSPDISLDQCHLRVDWQTLRRLPLSGAIIFNFKALFTPVTEFRDEPFIPAIVERVLKEGKRSLMEYKNTWHVEHLCIPALQSYAQEQIRKGLVPQDWEVHTLEDQPFFPGWEDKWHMQQGF